MLKKIGYGYLTLVVALTLLTVLGKGIGPDTDAGFVVEVLTASLLLLSLWSIPIVLLVLSVVFIRRHFRRSSIRQFATQAEKFHIGRY